MPKVTVLMAVYNGEHYLRETIDSILAQTFQDFEFLIVNDGSADSTQEIIQSYDDSRIRLVNNERNIGLTRSLNKGLELAKGEFIARQDADDVSQPERLAKQVAFLETHPEVALLGTGYQEIDAQGNLIGEGNLPCTCTQIRWDLLFYSPFIHSAVMWRKNYVLEQVGFYNESYSYAQDYDLWCRIARTLQVANLSESLVKYRVIPSSMTATYGDRTQDEPIQIRVSNVGYLLNLDTSEVLNKSMCFDMMTSLMIGSQNEIELQKVNIALQEILQLHKAFCECYALNQSNCNSLYTQLRIRVSRQLLEFAYYFFYQNNSAAARQLLNQAYHLYWRILREKKFIKLVVKLRMETLLIRAKRYLFNGKISKLLSDLNK